MGDLTYTNSMMNEIRELLLNARQHVAVQVNTELLSTYWNVGRIIVEHEQEIRNVPTMASRLSSSFQRI